MVEKNTEKNVNGGLTTDELDELPTRTTVSSARESSKSNTVLYFSDPWPENLYIKTYSSTRQSAYKVFAWFIGK